MALNLELDRFSRWFAENHWLVVMAYAYYTSTQSASVYKQLASHPILKPPAVLGPITSHGPPVCQPVTLERSVLAILPLTLTLCRWIYSTCLSRLFLHSWEPLGLILRIRYIQDMRRDLRTDSLDIRLKTMLSIGNRTLIP